MSRETNTNISQDGGKSFVLKEISVGYNEDLPYAKKHPDTFFASSNPFIGPSSRNMLTNISCLFLGEGTCNTKFEQVERTNIFHHCFFA